MDFDPNNFTSLAELFHANRQLFPTDMGSAELRTLDAQIKRASLFSARSTNAHYLQGLREWITAILHGDTNEATARYELQKILSALGYTPEHGFPENPPGLGIPPAERGSLQDLASEARLRLILDTQREMANGFGMLQSGSTEMALFQFPCWELVRLYSVEIPRGERQGPKGTIVEVPGDDWPSRFAKAGGTVIDGRCVARKDDAVWQNLGDPDLFDDGLGNPFPPFWFNSGGGWDSVRRSEAIELGVIDEDDESPTAPADSKKQLPDFITIDGEHFAADILRTLKAGLLAIKAA